jgi:hypothetical protein
MLSPLRNALLLSLAALLLACNAGIEDIGLHDAGWKTYRNHDFAYEVSYPNEWEVSVRNPWPGDAIETQWVRLSGMTERRDTPPSLESVLVAVNFQASWCTEAGRIEIREIVVSGVPGIEQECFRTDPACEPKPNCLTQPYGLARFFPDALGVQNYLVLGDPTSDPLLVRRIIESFRFLEGGREGGE